MRERPLNARDLEIFVPTIIIENLCILGHIGNTDWLEEAKVNKQTLFEAFYQLIYHLLGKKVEEHKEKNSASDCGHCVEFFEELVLDEEDPLHKRQLGCCFNIRPPGRLKSWSLQFFIARDEAHLIVVSSLVFAAIDPIVVDSKAVLQKIINRETHRNIMSSLERKSWDVTDNDLKKGLSINKVSAIDTYYQEIRALMLNLVTLLLSLGSLVAESWSKSKHSAIQPLTTFWRPSQYSAVDHQMTQCSEDLSTHIMVSISDIRPRNFDARGKE
ncbi:hypothetical protein KCU89_g74, partial [Aureobasidium melanogenum]